MLSKIRFLLFIVFATITLPIVYLIMLFSKDLNRKSRYIWCKYGLTIFGIKWEIVNKPKELGNFYLVNHRSFLDIFLLEAILDEKYNLCWIAKSELKKNPVINKFMIICEMVAVDRVSARGLIRLVKDIQKPLSQNRPLMIFPEGTRNKGDGLLPFKAGAKFLAEKKDLFIQPVIITNSDKLLNTKKMKLNSGVCKIEFLSPRKTDDEKWFEILREDMIKSYNQLS